MPEVAHTASEVKILRWHKKEGEPVEEGEVLLEVETDKATLEIESYAGGILRKIYYQEQELVLLGETIALIGEGEEPLPPELLSSARQEPERPGPAQKKVEEVSPIPSPTPGRIMALSPMRKAIAQRMTQSFREVPHLVLKTRVQASGLIKLREALNASLPEEHKITFSDTLLKAIGLALFSFPQVNSLFEEDQIRELPHINVGLAIATGEGLIAPVVPEVDKKSLKEISQHTRALIQRARQGRLLSSDLKEAALTLSNLGMFGIEEFTAIINPPQAAILAVGRIAPEPIVQGEKITPAPCLHLTLSADHRLLDGVLAAQFLGEIKDILENPGRMLV